MAGGAGRRGGGHVCPSERETGDAVIEGSGVPTFGGVAGGAVGSGEGRAGRGVRGIVGLLPSGEVATRITAICGSSFQTVVAVDVAGRANHVGMSIGERKAGGTVVEFAISPSGDAVAGGTSGSGGGESCSDVVRHRAAHGCRFIPVAKVAGEAVGRTERIVIVHVAGSTGRGCGRFVRPDQREARDAVIEGCRVPSLHGMAIGAIGRGESRAGSGVNGSRGLLPLVEMAAGVAAIGRSCGQGVIIVDMAGGARNVGMAIGEQKARAAVVESDIGP